ncbi:hypothetical protein K438DRAFT_1875998 [Mycena galopus ATCC 62051]|nr:hypothetical protein K438DRAFT_1875998 [Mycena galopus ATCC 62051]
MPFPKLFKRRRTTSVINDTTHAVVSQSLTVPPLPDLRYSMSMPQLVIPQNGLPIAVSPPPVNGGSGFVNGPPPAANGQPPTVNGHPPAVNGHLNGSIPTDSKLLPPTPVSPQVSSAPSEIADNMGDMWRDINDRSPNISKAEKIINKISDTAGTAVKTESSTDGVVGFVKSVVANDTVKAIGNTILEGVPGMMSALETLTEVHPFLKGAEMQRRDNDQKRNALFGKIKDVMFILLELKDFKKDDTRTTPDNKPVLSRLASICKDMKKDIQDCYNVINTQEKRSLSIKFLKAGAWNKELASYATRFTNRRADLTFALSLRTAVTIEEMNTKMMDMFTTMMTPQERDMGRWIDQNGGEKVVLGNDKKCAAMIKYEASIAASNGAVGHADKTRSGTDEDSKKEEKAIAALRKEYRDDIQGIIQENLESYSKRFEMGLDDLGKDLGNKIQHQGDRLIKYLRGGPHQRIKDKIIYHVWKDQGWKGSAKTRPLVLALRDYFVERIEYSKLPPTQDVVQKQRPISSVPKEDDDEDDTETDMSVPLPDSWMAAYLQVKRLRYLEQALDPDASGFTTISEINNFTHQRPEDWSFPRWCSYWAIGWQIYATKYCVEIEELFGQIDLLKAEIAVKMPGNTGFVNTYIEGCWTYVSALTSSIERYTGTETWLEEKFKPYIQSQEKILKERLEKIEYDVDSLETVALLLRVTASKEYVPVIDLVWSNRFVQSIFILLALLIRRHVAKMHLCLKQEINSDELWDDMDTLVWVTDAVWARFIDLKEQFQHQEIVDLKLMFEWLSCGLFKNYWKWDKQVDPKYFVENDPTVWTSDTIRELDPSELVGILTYTSDSDDSSSDTSSESGDSDADSSGTPTVLPSVVGATEAAAAEATPKTDSASPVLSKPSEAEMSITGTWYGFHATETQSPFLAMVCFNVKCGDRQEESECETKISGDGVSMGGQSFTLSGTINSADQPVGSLALTFERIYTDDGTSIQYHGIFKSERETMTGTFERSIASGSFLFKKVPSSAIMCARPMVPELSTKELWSFALNVVVSDLRRKTPSVSYICERMTSVRRVIGFMYQDNRDLLTETEGQAEYSKLLKTFSFEQIREINKLYEWYNRAADLQPGNTCDGCASSLIRSRIVCLDCMSTDGPEQTVDFCSKLECIASESIPQRTDVQHSSSHLMVRFRDLLLIKDYFAIKQRARSALDYALEHYNHPTDDISFTLPLPSSPILISSVANVDGDSNTETQTNVPVIVEMLQRRFRSMRKNRSPALDPGTPVTPCSGLLSAAVTPVEATPDESMNCVVCHERVVAPCWNCVPCYGNTWLCDSCEKATNELAPWDYQKRYRAEVEAMGGKDDRTAHTVFHAMVRVVRPSTEAKPNGNDAAAASTTELSSPLGQWEQIEKRVQELVTARFEAVNSQVNSRLDAVETKLATGLANIERLLNLMAARS